MKKVNFKEPMHVIQASRLTKAELIALLFKDKEWGFIEPNLPERFWKECGGDFHPPLYVYDKRVNPIRPINLIELGIQKGLFYKTTFN